MPEQKNVKLRLAIPLAEKIERFRKARELRTPGLQLSFHAALIILLERGLTRG